MRAATNGMIVSLAEMWEYSQRKWCSVHHEYFQLVRSPTTARSHLAHQPVVLGVGVRRHQVLVDEPTHEQTELHADLHSVVRPRGAPQK